MPNRILKESIRTSETINALDGDEEAFWYRLLTVLDDYGRYDGRPAIVLAACYPLRLDTVNVRDVTSRLHRLVELGMVALYEVDGKVYLEAVNWKEHQRLRSGYKSKWPAPEDGDPVLFEVTPPQVAASRRKSPRVAEGSAVGVGDGDEGGSEKTGAPIRRKPDPLYLALCSAVGIDPQEQTRAAKRAAGIATNEIRRAGGKPEQVAERAQNYLRHFTGAAITIPALAKHWAQCAHPPAERRTGPGMRSLELAEQARKGGEHGNGTGPGVRRPLGSGLRP